MQSRADYISDLLLLSLKNELNDRQRSDLDQWLQESDANRRLFDELSGDNLEQGFKEMARIDVATAFEKVKLSLSEELQTVEPSYKKVWMRPRFYWTAAACVAGIVCLIIWLAPEKKEIASPGRLVQQDVPAGQQGALLTLANGTTVLLDTIQNATIALQGGVTAKVVDGMLLYEGEGSEVVMNSISTPKGRQYHMLLPDGSGVWLNAASAIRYPNQFSGKDRVVHLTGEAFFDVKHDADRPFRVIAHEQTEVLVLGTRFNINAYVNEDAVTATLLKGAVAVKAPSSEVKLKPGEQAQVKNQGAGTSFISVSDADTSKAVAWRDGIFNFNGSGVPEVMRQLERWYDIEVVYDAGVPAMKIGGELSKDLSLSRLLKGLEVLGLRTEMTGKKVTVLK